jgi:3-hydroxyisobutyrate dehydrogenase-like beta-hydroxyacid dehydrogenase
MEANGKTPRTIGFVGLGDMGAPIAANYARKGFDLLAYDLRPELESQVVSWGGRWAQDATDLIQRSDVLCICLLDDHQVRGFIDQQRVFEHLRAGTTLVIHSTVLPSLIRDLTREASERGIEVVDAPVSGSHAARGTGALTVMVGSTPDAFERLRSLFAAMSSHAYWIGDVPGCAQVVKLCNNMLGETNNLVALEGLRIAQAYGISETTFLDVVRVSSGNSWIIENWGTSDRLSLNHPYGANANFLILLKDLRSAIQVGSEAGVTSEIASQAAAAGERILENRLQHIRGAPEPVAE